MRNSLGRCAVCLALSYLASSAAGAELIVVVKPKCALDPAANLKKLPFTPLKPSAISVVAGDKPANVKTQGEAYLLELGPTTVVTSTLASRLYLDDNPKVLVDVKALQVRLLQPYVFWYVKEAGAAPVPLGDGFSYYLSLQLAPHKENRYTLRKMGVPELTTEGMEKIMEQISQHAQNSLAAKIVVGPMDRITFASAPQAFNNANESDLIRKQDRPSFRPGKVTYEKNGGAVIEMTVQNKFPFTIGGDLRRREPAQEMIARSQLPNAIDIANQTLSEHFELKPNEKAVLKFTLVPQVVSRGLPEQSTFEVNQLKLGSK